MGMTNVNKRCCKSGRKNRGELFGRHEKELDHNRDPSECVLQWWWRWPVLSLSLSVESLSLESKHLSALMGLKSCTESSYHHGCFCFHPGCHQQALRIHTCPHFSLNICSAFSPFPFSILTLYWTSWSLGYTVFQSVWEAVIRMPQAGSVNKHLSYTIFGTVAFTIRFWVKSFPLAYRELPSEWEQEGKQRRKPASWIDK